MCMYIWCENPTILPQSHKESIWPLFSCAYILYMYALKTRILCVNKNKKSDQITAAATRNLFFIFSFTIRPLFKTKFCIVYDLPLSGLCYIYTYIYMYYMACYHSLYIYLHSLTMCMHFYVCV